MESKIIKLKESYKLSLKNVEPYGDLVKRIYNLNLEKKELISLYKTINDYIQGDKELAESFYNSK